MILYKFMTDSLKTQIAKEGARSMRNDESRRNDS